MYAPVASVCLNENDCHFLPNHVVACSLVKVCDAWSGYSNETNFHPVNYLVRDITVGH